ncbi:MarR family winged helix-turn-helix transcriptional regulator [Brevibacterium sp. 50QC2O2]|uniref:MarR family winged helix-turn-helix transcriptional regulator n=1 Tax=Brevibacterium TaxID=1696 RepID=UPI00211C1CBD|nr:MULTISPECIES: MarR family winged helix-turn-helix transcriptional regulator [unclassified Brevibacterium]MCQ9384573.1 MarR family winged helix-turn-helix transcriptional regulator [Brevibacterium sp. 68QC2CO]MCQ9387903.1 MarR family winged helix-turn-helix transcriptional regulator [Brevibacterium sp. 50QC2O2]
MSSASPDDQYDTGAVPPLLDLVHQIGLLGSQQWIAGSKFAQARNLNFIDFSVLSLTLSASSELDTPPTPGYLSDRLALSASTLTSILERLASADYITRERDAADRRRISIMPTQKARDLITDYHAAIFQSFEKTMGDLGNEEVMRMILTLRGLIKPAEAALEALDARPPRHRKRTAKEEKLVAIARPKNT